MIRILRFPHECNRQALPFLIFTVALASFVLLGADDIFAQPGQDPGGLSGAYRLIGTIGGNAIAGAVVSDGKGEQTFVRLYEKLPDGSQLIAVRDDSISIKGSDGTRYDMFISHETKPSSPAKPVAEARPAPPVDPYTGGAVPGTYAGHQNATPQQPAKRRPGRSGRAGSEAD